MGGTSGGGWTNDYPAKVGRGQSALNVFYSGSGKLGKAWNGGRRGDAGWGRSGRRRGKQNWIRRRRNVITHTRKGGRTTSIALTNGIIRREDLRSQVKPDGKF